MKKIEIKSCSDCPHKDSTGGFTKGGAKSCCDHPTTVRKLGDDCFKRIIPSRREYVGNSGRYYLSPKKIPQWCPLKEA